ncbi:substrate-binding domain-containing protein [Kitasatospora sp. NPDC096204]|uniref:substrate-binding domain-containing protein n=1 Tax=Kitasatospora sp. NPDC096204 TaxID=3364094 RepID=UPI003817456E
MWFGWFEFASVNCRNGPECASIGFAVPTDPRLALFGALVEPLPLDCTEESAAELTVRCRELALDGPFGYNDEYAMLALRALQDAGVDVPGAVALVGADDLLLARLLRPLLSSVRMRLPSGEELAELVDRMVSDPEAPPVSLDLMTVELIARGSS